MDNELMDIVETKYGYKLFENKIMSVVSKIIFTIIYLTIGFIIVLVDFEKIIYPIQILTKIILCVVILFLIYGKLFLDKTIKIYKDKIEFHIDSKPLKLKIIKISKIDINEISINYEINYEEDSGEVYYYNLDLIDKEFNAYRLGKSKNYNKIFNYGTKIVKILNAKFIDNNDIEGYGHVFKKRVV
jgi:hypothetical protein